jgi:hypothetical protein
MPERNGSFIQIESTRKIGLVSAGLECDKLPQLRSWLI